MNRKLIFIPVVLLAVAGLWYWQSSAHANAPNGPIYGNVDIREVNLAFRVGGRVAEVAVDEGDRVKAGQVLAKLDAAPLDNTLHSAQAQLAALTARNALLHEGFRQEDIDQAQARHKAAQAALIEADAELARQKALVPAGATAQKNLDAAQSLRDQAAAQLSVTQAALHLATKGYRRQELAESDAQLQQAKANVEAAKLAQSDTVLLAPSDGVVLTRAIEKGAMVNAGGAAFGLSLTQPVWARAYVPEPQLGQFANGVAVTLSTDSRPGKPYHGVVGFVSPTAEFTPKAVETTDLRTSLVYRVRVVVQDADDQLRQGMPVTIQRAP